MSKMRFWNCVEAVYKWPALAFYDIMINKILVIVSVDAALLLFYRPAVRNRGAKCKVTR
jgi:hypothetical protein